MNFKINRWGILGAGAFVLVVASMVVAQGASIGELKPVIEERFPRAKWISQAQLQTRLKKNKPTLLLDARTADEFAVSHLKSAVRIDPDAPNFKALPPSGDVECAVVYCSVGYRSADITRQLIDKGYKARNLEGGLFAWANSGRKFYKGAKRAKKVHPYDAVWGKLLKPHLRAPLR